MKPRDPDKLSEREAKCLAAIAARVHGQIGYGVFFSTVAKKTGLDHSATRRAVRALARKGFLEYIRGLFDESDGLLVGSGYGLTPAGRARAEALPK